MKKEDFFEVLGDLDDDLVKGAKTMMKKKMNRRILGTAIAACLALVLFAGAAAFYLRQDSEQPIEPNVAFATPMVCVNGVIYMPSREQESDLGQKENLVYLGEIESTTDKKGAPNQNFQTNNLNVGSKVYQDGEYLVVESDGQYRQYQAFIAEVTVNKDGTYNCKDIDFKYFREVSGTAPMAVKESTFLIVTNREDIGFDEVFNSMITAEMTTGTPEFFILGWY